MPCLPASTRLIEANAQSIRRNMPDAKMGHAPPAWASGLLADQTGQLSRRQAESQNIHS